MRESPIVAPGVQTVTGQATAAAVPPARLNAIQLIEQEILGFVKQREQAIANVHAVDGAIQAAQHLVAKLRAEAARAEAEAKKLVTEAVAELEKIEKSAEQVTSNVTEFVKKEL